MAPYKTSRHAFTLIELLVVISIIALLVSILLPALGTARDSAVSIQCASQLRQVHLAFEVYRGENANYYPGMGAWDEWLIESAGVRYWYEVMFNKGRYLDPDVGKRYRDYHPNGTSTYEVGMLGCPAEVYVAGRGKDLSVTQQGTTYGMNWKLYRSYYVDNSEHEGNYETMPLPVEIAVRKPTEIYFMGDIGGAKAQENAHMMNWDTSRSSPSGFQSVRFRHMESDNSAGPWHLDQAGQTNMTFFDGHVESLATKDVPRAQSKWTSTYPWWAGW